MIDRRELLSDLQKLLTKLEADLLERSESGEVPEVGKTLRAEYDRAKAAERTAQNYVDWRTDAITQAAAAWVLSCVFVRFLEDNRLIDPPKISGLSLVIGQLSLVTGHSSLANDKGPRTNDNSTNDQGPRTNDSRLQRARDEHELYFRNHPKETDREYLLAVFDELAKLPGTKDVFGEHNPIRELPNWLSGDAAGELLRFFQKIDANTGALVHDFTDPNWDTRFLGDLYQDLSEAARKKYALLQTPEFVEEFILDQTLNPALDEFGLVIGHSSLVTGHSQMTNDKGPMTNDIFKMIDPACGSGHFLLGAFRRILDRWEKIDPKAKCRVVVQRALESIYGVDVNPYAVAIARFRLLLAALKECGVMLLSNSPAFHINVVCGDSLLHAPLRGGQQVLDFELTSGASKNDDRDCEHAYQSENLPELKRMLRGGQYHAVVANPPYIVPKDRQLNERYRKRFTSCHMKYSLAVPFLERIFRLAVAGGYTGQITANSFMKREFGKKLIEAFFPTVDLTHVIDTSGAYVPGHGTPTVILFGRNRPPVASTLRTVMGIRGEPATPDDPARGMVWSAIIAQVDQPGSQSEFVSVGDSSREQFHKHPWSIGGGGAAELKEQLEELCATKLDAESHVIGITAVTGEDELYMQPLDTLQRRGIELTRQLVVGDIVRDWQVDAGDWSIWLYDEDLALITLDAMPQTARLMWSYRAAISQRRRFGTPMIQRGLSWYEWQELYAEKLRTPLSIVFAFVATHNHFALDRGGKVFKQSAPVIKLPRQASEDDHFGLLGLLNSSTACFWMKQVFHDKGSTVDAHGARQTTVAFENFREFTSTGLLKFPLPTGRPLSAAKFLDSLATTAAGFRPRSLIAIGAPTRRALDMAESAGQFVRSQMIAVQEELDWECYWLYGLIDVPLTRTVANVSGPPGQSLEATAMSAFVGLELGQRAFEIVTARKMARGELQSTWFERHGSTPITELPAEWPDDYRQLVERRIALIASDPNIRLIEQPEYKRRWNTEPWDSQLERALREWLLDRLESYFDFDGRMKPDISPGGTPVGSQGRQPLESVVRQNPSPGGATVGVASSSIAPPGLDASESDESQGLTPLATNDRRSAAKTLLADIALVSVAMLADVARQDAEFQQVGELYRDDPAFDVQALVAELVAAECVPLLPVLRYKPSGLIKRGTWERTWELQRQEDELSRQLSVISGQLEAAKDEQEKQRLKAEQERLTTENRQLTTSIPIPTKYDSKDFLGSNFWRLRGKLDVPKERWVSFPHCEGPDGTLVIAWAGYDHLQQARAISAYYVRVQTEFGGTDDARLIPLLACLIELLPWLRQWHNEPDAAFDGMRMGDYFEGFAIEEARQLGKTLPEIKAWQPPKKAASKKRK